MKTLIGHVLTLAPIIICGVILALFLIFTGHWECVRMKAGWCKCEAFWRHGKTFAAPCKALGRDYTIKKE